MKSTIPSQQTGQRGSEKPVSATHPAPHQRAILNMQQQIGNRRTLQLLGRVQRRTDEIPPTPEELRQMQEEMAEQRRREQAYNAASATPLRTDADLITLVERVEAAYPGEDWRGVTTRIRKSYYDGFLWDSMIAPRADYPGLSWPPLTVEDYKAFATARSHPELRINGESVDIGHVFTGLDAMNFPSTGMLMSAAGVDGPPGATWSGDVGSALAEWDLNASSEPDRRLEYYNRFASSDDMLGDVDGIAITRIPADMPAGSTLSSRLRWYYQGTGGGASGSRQRYTKFCQAAGFRWTGRGAGIQWDSAVRPRVRTQIENFALAWRRKGGGMPGFNWFHDRDLDWFTDHFLDWLKQGLSLENP